MTGILSAADPVTVETTAELVAALHDLNETANSVIQLKVGDYDLPSEAMYTNATTGIGSIYVNKVKLIGLGTKPEDVRLIGTGSMRAVLATSSAWLENLMITNGITTAGFTPEGGTKIANSTRGGGVYGGTITNCVITGCAGSHGGGVASANSIYCSKLIGNTASFGGAFFDSSIYGCTLKDNVASSAGGAVWFNGKYTVRDCIFIDNRATGKSDSGGAIYSQGTGTKIVTVTNCIFSGNSAVNGGGGACAGYSSEDLAMHLWNCVVSNNTAKSGGGCSRCTLHNCTNVNNVAAEDGGGASESIIFGGLFSGNVARRGGGIYLKAGGSVSNCLVYGNMAKASASAHGWGGGIYTDSLTATIFDTEIAGNYACTDSGKLGLTGGVQGGTMINCSIHDNYADSLAGACRAGIARNCRIYNNASGDVGANGHSMEFIGCDISNNSLCGGSALGCVFHDFDSNVTHTLTNNPFKSSTTYTCNDMWIHGMNATNCLFTGNRVGVMFSGFSAGGFDASLVNCTIVSNAISALLRAFQDSNHPMQIINCAFVDNTDESDNPRDIHFGAEVSAGGTHLAYCLYGTTSVANLSDYAWSDPLYQLGVNGIAASPRFNLKGEHPFEPRPSSPLVNRGQVMDWMDGAYDIRGEIEDGKYLRLRDSKVDIGCYQTRLIAVGLCVSIR